MSGRRGLSGPLQPPPDVRWRASADGIGHAFEPTGRAPAVCGSPRWEARWDHPVATRHQQCVDEVNRRANEALRGAAAESLGL